MAKGVYKRTPEIIAKQNKKSTLQFLLKRTHQVLSSLYVVLIK